MIIFQSSEYAHLEFLKSHISDILNLIAETGWLVLNIKCFHLKTTITGIGENPASPHLTWKGLCAVELAVHGARGRSHTQPLADLATLPSEVLSSGYSQVSGYFIASRVCSV